MWFRNLLVYHISGGNILPVQLEEALARYALQTCLAMEMKSRGWVTPKEDQENFVYILGQQLLIAFGVEKKLLPAAVVNQHARVRLQEIELLQGYKPGKKQVRDIKEATLIELLPRAFTQRQRTFAWIDTLNQRLVIDTANMSKADDLIELLLKAVPDLKLKPVDTKTSPSSVMTKWLAGGDLPSVFTIDQDCELQGQNDEKSTIRYKRHHLNAEETVHHIREGKRVIKLAMTWNNKISFMLHDNLQIRRVAPQDILQEPAESEEEQFASDFIMMTGEVSQMIDAIIEALGGEDYS